MWPFKKKPKVQSFQEFRRTYVPSEPRVVSNPIETESVCSVCCDIFPPGTVSADYPFCPDCSSEGIELQVVPLADFLAATTAEGLNDLLMRWEAIDGFLPAFKDLKSQRIRHLLALKLGSV
jgi:hypothetical protein